ncbi:prepilin-type N-terminal cleavage/methylation domain-containing protein [Agathobaculum sp.]|uniref:prepilin-type N-terminal cleavage/methylation domain-containing protein n=1 Tax=Agathobaculum sp. TaxID=2048138 RepID=UPI002A83A33A|nr:prepilin-type N-terminal cleavage/methylation domain-containing protein [Agathobaculum sp.]MDY3617757.1 prepilin-type N-terminal cleavage/methylation domain-containing protein [Agathobaculum sp.]
MFAKLCAKRSKKGFTLAELLIVVAIIAILVAIAIPVFSAQLNNARTQVSEANKRAALSMAHAQYLLDEGANSKYYIHESANHEFTVNTSADGAVYTITFDANGHGTLS